MRKIKLSLTAILLSAAIVFAAACGPAPRPPNLGGDVNLGRARGPLTREQSIELFSNWADMIETGNLGDFTMYQDWSNGSLEFVVRGNEFIYSYRSYFWGYENNRHVREENIYSRRGTYYFRNRQTVNGEVISHDRFIIDEPYYANEESFINYIMELRYIRMLLEFFEDVSHGRYIALTGTDYARGYRVMMSVYDYWDEEPFDMAVWAFDNQGRLLGATVDLMYDEPALLSINWRRPALRFPNDLNEFVAY